MAHFRIWQLLALLLCITLVRAEIERPASDPIAVPDLKPSEIPSFVKAHEKVLITYCTPYGGHCKRMFPQIQAAQDLLRETGIRLANIDCNDFDIGNFCSQEGIKAYPTLRIYERGVDGFEEFTGYRDRKALTNYLLGMNWPTSTTAAPKPTKHHERPKKPAPPNPSPDSTANNVLYRGKDGADAIVKLELPGLPINLLTVPESLRHSSSVILQFNFTEDGKHVMLNGQALALQVPSPSVPALLTAKQVPLDYHIGDINGVPAHSRWAHGEFRTLGIDYEIFGRNRDDPNIRYYNYHPEIVINIIGCSSPDPAADPSDFLLDSLDQKVVKIKFEDFKASGASDDPNRAYRVEEMSFGERSSWSGFKPRAKEPGPGSPEYRVPRPDDKACSMWSWRCADIGDPPWYQYIWRRNFDDHGRIGCMRWRLSRSGLLPILERVIPPWWIWVPLLIIGLYLRLVRPLRQRSDGKYDSKPGSKD